MPLGFPPGDNPEIKIDPVSVRSLPRSPPVGLDEWISIYAQQWAIKPVHPEVGKPVVCWGVLPPGVVDCCARYQSDTNQTTVFIGDSPKCPELKSGVYLGFIEYDRDTGAERWRSLTYDYAYMYWNSELEIVPSGTKAYFLKVTHWMPLPPGP